MMIYPNKIRPITLSTRYSEYDPDICKRGIIVIAMRYQSYQKMLQSISHPIEAKIYDHINNKLYTFKLVHQINPYICIQIYKTQINPKLSWIDKLFNHTYYLASETPIKVLTIPLTKALYLARWGTISEYY